jgi:hypothetical protein
MLISPTTLSEVCNPLDSESCMNGGQCLPMMNGYQCLCTTGYSGRFCETSKYLFFLFKILLLLFRNK